MEDFKGKKDEINYCKIRNQRQTKKGKGLNACLTVGEAREGCGHYIHVYMEGTTFAGQACEGWLSRVPPAAAINLKLEPTNSSYAPAAVLFTV
ncbi:hypothetical protein PoB_000067500 [Plakobranchus ocellatus]|uniref:Uncharacterized protein n=1 Tax=Plakobranchus ocellatus TaxID=259542 RepID=A0AAV3XUW1_9GAST|nr:hypothetical protein PoB_000067500 [Plakobranchus ocellatus]